jgi:hypothetical protein
MSNSIGQCIYKIETTSVSVNDTGCAFLAGPDRLPNRPKAELLTCTSMIMGLCLFQSDLQLAYKNTGAASAPDLISSASDPEIKHLDWQVNDELLDELRDGLYGNEIKDPSWMMSNGLESI